MATPMRRVNEVASASIGNYLTNYKSWNPVAYNVLEYGLFGDGVTDNTAALQKLIDLAISEGRKAIYFPAGEYYVTSLTNADQVVFFGDNASFVGGYTGIIYQMGDWATNAQLADIALDVTTLGADRTGVLDSTSAVQKIVDSAPEGSTILFPRGRYRLSKIKIDRSNLTFDGSGSTILAFGTDEYIFSPEGTVSDVTIRNFRCEPLSDSDKTQFFFGNNSGQHLSRFNIHDNYLTDLRVGISLNCDLGGSVDSCKVFNNTIKNATGIESGHGYAIHVAGATNCEIFSNIIDNADRHSIYHGWGMNNSIHDNFIFNHKRDNPENEIVRAAIPIVRKSQNIDVYGNYFINCTNCCFHIWNDGYEGPGLSDGDLLNVRVHDNFMIGLNGGMAFYIGGGETSFNRVMENVYVQDNLIYSDGNYDSANKQNIVIITRGINLYFERNKIHLHGVSERMHAIQLFSDDPSVAENITVKDNIIEFKGDDISACRALYYGNTMATSTTTCDSRNNQLLNYRSSSGVNYFAFTSAVTVTNYNLSILSPNITLYRNSLPTSGYYLFNDMILIDDMRSTRQRGWKCTSSGNPGTWEAIYYDSYITSIAGTPKYIGQEALSAGIWYKAKGTSSPADWVAISS